MLLMRRQSLYLALDRVSCLHTFHSVLLAYYYIVLHYNYIAAYQIRYLIQAEFYYHIRAEKHNILQFCITLNVKIVNVKIHLQQGICKHSN